MPSSRSESQTLSAQFVPAPKERLCLASASLPRQRLLKWGGFDFVSTPAGIAEDPLPQESPQSYLERMVWEKGRAVQKQHPQHVVLSADTIVLQNQRIFQKPRDAQQARWTLQELSGKKHQVYTALLIQGSKNFLQVVKSTVTFRPLTPWEVQRYVALKEGMEAAGAYAIQGYGGSFVADLQGSLSNVIGLPMEETIALLQSCHIFPKTTG